MKINSACDQLDLNTKNWFLKLSNEGLEGGLWH